MINNNKILSDLIELGLGKNEAEVYLGLLELGESKAGPLSKHVGVPTSHIYPVLDNLYKKGLISHKYANNIRIFYSNPPETLKTLYVEKQKELDAHKNLLLQSIETINRISITKDTFADYKYFEGISGIVAMWQEIIRDLVPNTEIQVLSGNEEALGPFDNVFMEFQKARVKKNIRQRLIFPKKMDLKYSRERIKLGLIKIRYTELEPHAEICLFHDYMAIEYLGTKKEKPRAFLIKDRLFVDYFRLIFDVIWNGSKER